MICFVLTLSIHPVSTLLNSAKNVKFPTVFCDYVSMQNKPCPNVLIICLNSAKEKFKISTQFCGNVSMQNKPCHNVFILLT